MNHALNRILNGVDQFINWMGRATSWLVPILVLLVCFDVFSRYVFGESQIWMVELEWHLFAVIFLIGAAYTLQEDKHVRVDVFYSKFSRKDKGLVNFIGTLILLIPWGIVLLVYSFEYAMDAYRIGEGSPNPGGIPAWYVIKFVLPLGILLLLLQALVLLFKSLKDMKT